MDISTYSPIHNPPPSKRTCCHGQQEILSHGCDVFSMTPNGIMNFGQNSNSFGLEFEYNPVMDSSIWSQLHEDLIERILAWLPVASFLRLRVVCKKWSVLMYARGFLEVCASVPTINPYFVKASPNCEYNRFLSSYNPMLNKWHTISMNFLPTQVGYPIASAGGLICYMSKFHGYVDDLCSIFVCNPLTKCWKEIPSSASGNQRPVLVSMVAEGSPSKYQIIVSGNSATEVYDSKSNSWQSVGCLPRGEEVSRNAAFCNGNLYCLTPRWYNCSLLVYNLKQESWTKVKTGRLPGYCQFRNLVGCRDQIMIVGKSIRHQVLCVCIWMLDQKTLKWREIGRMPRCMSDHFLGRPSESFHCTGYGNLMCLTRDNCEMGLLFDICQKSWRWVLGCPNSENFALEPRLDALV